MSDIDVPEEVRGVVQIDENNLDKECIRLPSDYLKWAWWSADLKRDADEAKARLAVVQADLSNKVRSSPGDYGLDKVTEAGISAVILSLATFQKAQKGLQEANYQAEMAQAVIWALEHKKRSLTLLVDLHGMGYFSTVKLTQKGRQAVEDMTKQRVRRPREEE